ncbi:MAG TPA: hypothetical protein VG605_03250 [Puia sp.]|jgi:hypothetical protein|nr:hypothetical protein [Puia sp.]HWB90836.1 hypothetical protein [Puia sp.]
MSLSMEVYTREIPAGIVEKLLKRLNEFDMTVEVHPEFEFDEMKDSGFVPFKFQFIGPAFGQLDGKQLMSGFELYIGSFDLAKAKEALRPKQGFLDRLLGRKKPEPPPFAPPEIEQRLKDCTKVTSFVWHGGDVFQLRFALLTSAIFTELTNGLCCDPDDRSWLKNDNIAAKAFEQVCDYEESLSNSLMEYSEFEGW